MSIKCPKCEFENLENATFCIKCGSRLDGKIVCPKCGEYIPSEASYCPHCGKEIPHESISKVKKQTVSSSKKAGIAKIFNKISAFVCIGFFATALLVLFLNYFKSDSSFRPDLLIYFADQYDGFSYQSDINKILIIIRTVIVAINLSVVILFSTIGIVKTVKCLKHKTNLTDSYKYVVVVLTSHILTTSLLIASSGFIDAPELSSVYQTFILNSFIHLFVCLAFDCFMNFKKGQVSIFIARILLSSAFFLLIISISVFGRSYLSNNGVQHGLIYHLVETFYQLNSGPVDTTTITLLLSVMGITIFSFVYLMCAYSTITYLSSAFFGGMTKLKRFRLIYYMSTITLSILATALLISSIIEIVLYSNYVGDATTIKANGIAIVVFLVSALIIGITIATFTIYNRFNRRVLLKEKTTKVE